GISAGSSSPRERPRRRAREDDSRRAHLKALAHISRLLTKQKLHGRILAARDKKELLQAIAAEEPRQ
ncbi:unnamed protein product, partial [marine sediment metagenome]